MRDNYLDDLKFLEIILNQQPFLKNLELNMSYSSSSNKKAFNLRQLSDNFEKL